MNANFACSASVYLCCEVPVKCCEVTLYNGTFMSPPTFIEHLHNFLVTTYFEVPLIKMNVGCQFSSGDQGPNRQIFAASSYRVCPQCKGKDIKNDKHCAGGRRNGDAYGTEVFTCQTCQWETSFMYDEGKTHSLVLYLAADIKLQFPFQTNHRTSMKHDTGTCPLPQSPRTRSTESTLKPARAKPLVSCR